MTDPKRQNILLIFAILLFAGFSLLFGSRVLSFAQGREYWGENYAGGGYWLYPDNANVAAVEKNAFLGVRMLSGYERAVSVNGDWKFKLSLSFVDLPPEVYDVPHLFAVGGIHTIDAHTGVMQALPDANDQLLFEQINNASNVDMVLAGPVGDGFTFIKEMYLTTR